MSCYGIVFSFSFWLALSVVFFVIHRLLLGDESLVNEIYPKYKLWFTMPSVPKLSLDNNDIECLATIVHLLVCAWPFHDTGLCVWRVWLTCVQCYNQSEIEIVCLLRLFSRLPRTLGELGSINTLHFTSLHFTRIIVYGQCWQWSM